jgi:hypothetical protein
MSDSINISVETQAEIVRQRLVYHFAKIGGGWMIDGMNAPFMNEFLNEVNTLVKLCKEKNQTYARVPAQ